MRARPGYGWCRVVHRWQGNFLAGHPGESKPSQLHNAFLGQGFNCRPHLFMFGAQAMQFSGTPGEGPEPAQSIGQVLCRLALSALPS